MRTPEELIQNVKRAARIGGRVVAAGIVAGALNLPVRHISSQTPDVRPEDLVFVTEDVVQGLAGCDGIAVFDINQEKPLHRDAWEIATTRINANPDLSNVLALNYDNYVKHEGTVSDSFLYNLRRETARDYADGSTELIVGADFFNTGGIEFAADNDNFLVGIDRGTDYPWADNYFVNKYSLSEVTPTSHNDELSGLSIARLGEVKGSISLHESPPLHIIVDKNPDLFGGREVAHIVTNDRIITLDIETMQPMLDDVKLVEKGYQFWGPASISADGRYLVTENYSYHLEVADLVKRTSRDVNLRTNFDYVAGAAFNRGWENKDHFAVFGMDFTYEGDITMVETSLINYKFNGQYDPVELDRWTAKYPSNYPANPYFYTNADWPPNNPIAWSGSGSHLIAPFGQNHAEFMIVEVGTDGKLMPQYNWSVCPRSDEYHYVNLPNDIWTANGLIADPNETPTEGIPLPTGTALPTQTPTETLTTTPSNTPIPTETPTETETSTVTPTPTPSSTDTETATITSISTKTSTPEPSSTPTSTETPTLTSTSTDTATSTDTPTSTASVTRTPTRKSLNRKANLPAVYVRFMR